MSFKIIHCHDLSVNQSEEVREQEEAEIGKAESVKKLPFDILTSIFYYHRVT